MNAGYGAKKGSASLEYTEMMRFLFRLKCKSNARMFKDEFREPSSYFWLSATATATATVAPTMGLLPMPKKPIISTWAGTEEEPAN